MGELQARNRLLYTHRRRTFHHDRETLAGDRPRVSVWRESQLARMVLEPNADRRTNHARARLHARIRARAGAYAHADAIDLIDHA